MPVAMDTAPDAKPIIVTKTEGEIECRCRADPATMDSKSGKVGELIKIKHPRGSECKEETPKEIDTLIAVDEKMTEQRTVDTTRTVPKVNSSKDPLALDEADEHDDEGCHGDTNGVNEVRDGDDNNIDRGAVEDEKEEEKGEEEQEDKEKDDDDDEEEGPEPEEKGGSKIGDRKFDDVDAATAGDDCEAHQQDPTEAKRVQDHIESDVASDNSEVEIDTNVEPDSLVFSYGNGYASPPSSDTPYTACTPAAIASFPCYPNGAECLTDDGEYSMNPSQQQRIPAARYISESWNMFLFRGNEFFQKTMDRVTELEQVIEIKSLENKDLRRQVAQLKEENLDLKKENLDLKKVEIGQQDLENDKRELQKRLTIAVAKMNEYRQMYEQLRERNPQWDKDEPKSLHSSDSADNEHSSRKQESVTLAVDRGLSSIEEEPTLIPQERQQESEWESSVEHLGDSKDDDDVEVTLRAADEL